MRQYLSGFAFRTVTAGNTQVRRLGYFTAISQILPSSTPTADSVIRNLLSWASKNQEHLEEYARERDGQGAINPEHQSGPKRYLEVADGLQFVARTGGKIVLSRFGELLRTLAFLENTKNPFFLSHVELLFYAYWLLLNDADFLLLIMDAASEGQGLQLGDLQAQFQHRFIKRLEAKRALVSDIAGRGELGDAIQRARNKWQSPERYAEHIVPTRAGWLLDLGFLEPREFKKKRYVLSSQGIRLREALVPIPSRNLRDVTGDWLWGKSFTVIEESLEGVGGKTPWGELSDQERRTLLEEPMREGYRRFPLFGMRACSMLPTLIYCVVVLIVYHDVQVNLADLASWIDKQGASAGFSYGIRLSPLETDSYIHMID
ncbi:MAG: hypothetical protein DDT32_00957 [Syntrophomonadaceae bacterium]|nr:hypothetical protein [Bacillota bacterium]MBT9147205.1 hypothetical protein [Bacillota bacterium]